MNETNQLRSELERVKQQLDAANRREQRLRDAIIKSLEQCTACDGSGQDNDGESFISGPCKKCGHLQSALQPDAGKEQP